MTAEQIGLRVVSIHQPSYFPWLGLLDKIARSDHYVLMDEVQLSDGDYQHRNLFLTRSSARRFLTVPISKKGYREKVINQIELAGSEWQTDHLNFLRENYRGAPYYEETMAAIAPVYSRQYTHLIEVLVDSMRISMDLFHIPARVCLQSELDYDRQARKSNLVLALVKAVGCRVYLSGQGAKAYLDLDSFRAQGIDLRFQEEFRHPTYPQFSAGTAGFAAGLSCVDALFNLGREGCRRLLWESLYTADRTAAP